LRPRRSGAGKAFRHGARDRQRRRHIRRGRAVPAARLGVPRLAIRRTSLARKRPAALSLTRSAAPGPALALRPPMRPAMTLAEEFADRGIPVGRQPVHAVARLDGIGLGCGIEIGLSVAGRSGLAGRATLSPIALAVPG